MAIAASTSGVDRISRGDNGKTLFDEAKNVVGSTTAWYQGDLICFDTGTSKLRVVAATTDAATLVGISDNTISGGKLVGPYTGLTSTDAAEVSPGISGPKAGVTALMKLKVSDAFTPGCKVYLADGTDTQTVSVTDPGDANYIGIFQDVAVTAVAGSQGNVKIGARYCSGIVL